jgi:hypothetical protein
MTLIIGVRCKDDCHVIADRRTLIKCSGINSHRDDFHKVVQHDGFLVYNHGYNRIGDHDWKRRVSDLTADPANRVYSEIQKEMGRKPDRKAFYVFINMAALIEIIVCADTGITVKDHMPNERIVSGTGAKYVSLALLTDLQKKRAVDVRGLLEQTFRTAHGNMMAQGGNELSKEFDVATL